MEYKDIIIALKYGATTAELMEKFNFPTMASLIRSIKKSLPGQADDLIRRMKQNDKKLRRISHSVPSEETNEILNNSSEEQVIELTDKVVDETDEESNYEIEEISSVSEMEQLLKDEVEISDLLCNLENEHKMLVSKRKDIASLLNSKKTELEELLIKINQCEEEVTTHCAQYNELKVKMTLLDNEMADYREFLNTVRSRIEDLKQILILVTANDIEVENAKLPEITMAEVSAKFTELLTHEEVEILTVREIRTVARLILIVRCFENYEIVFENEKMENIFNQFNTVS